LLATSTYAASLTPKSRTPRGFAFCEPIRFKTDTIETKSAPMAKPVYILNGPNLNLLGKRQPDIYGSATLADVEASAKALAKELALSVECFQSNAEHALIDTIHAAREKASSIIINAGAFTHTSIAIFDALNMFEGPVLEVHISNIHKREHFRHHSYISARADGVIVGCGVEGYELALRRVASLLK
jgi:3-dehydroquinate dehydratase-2